MGNNLQYEDLMGTIKDLGVKQQKAAGPSDAEVNQNWLKLAGALKGK